MPITEMWLDRKTTSRGVEPTGSTAYIIPTSWQGHAVVTLVQIRGGKEAPLPLDIELLCMSLQPFYLPCEFPQLFFTVV